MAVTATAAAVPRDRPSGTSGSLVKDPIFSVLHSPGSGILPVHVS